jgi:hypothetical protein
MQPFISNVTLMFQSHHPYLLSLFKFETFKTFETFFLIFIIFVYLINFKIKVINLALGLINKY